MIRLTTTHGIIKTSTDIELLSSLCIINVQSDSYVLVQELGAYKSHIKQTELLKDVRIQIYEKNSDIGATWLKIDILAARAISPVIVSEYCSYCPL
jgi:hypothetical protein